MSTYTREQFIINREQSKIFEVAVGAWLRKRNQYVLPAYDYSGLGDDKPPMLRGKDENLVIPDLLAWRTGNGAWYEVKLKDRAVLYRNYQHLTTGINLRHYRHYRQVKTITGLPVFVVFVHQQEQCVKYGEIDALPVSHEYTGTKMGRDGMIFFEFDKIAQLMPYSELQAVAA